MEYLVDTRLSPVVRDSGHASLTELIGAIRTKAANSAQLVQKVVEALTTNETSFFRDIEPFDALKSILIPELIAKRQATRELTIWSAACSSGQEPYSIMFLIRESFPQLANWKIKVIATDINHQILDKARAGVFSQHEVNRGLPVMMLMKFFEKDGDRFVVKPEIRQSIEFRQLNLTHPFVGMPAPDLVFLRNVLIYFDLETKRQILSRVRALMKPDATLFLGAAETTINIDPLLVRRPLGKISSYVLQGS